MALYSRLICILPSKPTAQDLILDGVDVSVSILDMHAQVRMSQRFNNPYQSVVEATYSFAVLANSTVCGFEMIRGNGTKILGKVMEKKAAKEAYEMAVSEGKTASLGDEQTKDVFTIKVGNILASETVTVNLTFLTPLLDDEKRNQVRFTFPRGYAFRYGTPPTEDAARAFPTAGSAQAFNIAVTVQQSGPIKAISCPSSHPIQLSFGRQNGVDPDPAIPDSHFAAVNMTSPTSFLTQDFVLVVTADGLDAPRCFVETSPTPGENTTAFGMTFVPRFDLKDVDGGMEFIFVVDRSGSMAGNPIKLVREALIVLLRGLPTNQTSFNIFSFGSRANSLWPTSKDYTQSTLEEATRHVDWMEADYGGTEIARALKLVIDSLPEKREKPVSVFLLTDGGAWNVALCENHARSLVASPGAFGRIFTVGIGSDVSTNTVDSIARAGEGMAIYVQDGEAMTGKLARLVRASRTPAIGDIKVLWPHGEEDFEIIEVPKEVVEKDTSKGEQALPASISLYSEEDEETSGAVGPPPKLAIKPEDIVVPPIQRAPVQVRLFPGTRTQMYAIVSSLSTIPKSVQVQGKVATTGQIVQLEVPILKAAFTTYQHHGFIHILAARALITDREDGKHQFDSDIVRDSSTLEAHIEADLIRLGTKYGLTSRHTSYIAIDEHNPNHPLSTGPDLTTLSSREQKHAQLAQLKAGRAVSFLADSSEHPDKPRAKVAALSMASVSAGSSSVPTQEQKPEAKEEQGLTAVARLQQFDGSFQLSEQLLKAIGIAASAETVKATFVTSGSISEDIMATASSVVWMKREAAEEAEDMIEKAELWLMKSLGDITKVQELLAIAKWLIVL